MKTASAITEPLGGPARTRVVVVLALAMGLYIADMGAIGAMAEILERALDITKTDIGLLIAVSSFVTAVAALFYGPRVDRARRTRLFTIAIFLWSGVMVFQGFAWSFTVLLISRVAIGLFSAVTYPATASLIGDYFEPSERGRIYGYILSGELIGAGFGYLVSGLLADISWRLGFWALALPSLLLAWAVARLPEPVRGGGGSLRPGEQNVEAASDPSLTSKKDQRGRRRSGRDRGEDRLAARKVREARIQPREPLVLHVDPAKKSFWWAVRYILRIPTNLVLILASALGYFFFAGVRTFGVQFSAEWYGVSHALAILLLLGVGAAALVGVLVAGRWGDRRLARGDLVGRVRIAVYAYFVAIAAFVPALLFHTLWIALPTLIAATVALSAVNPPMDAARLDIMHPMLWGRAESVRFALRGFAEAAGPLAFGAVADVIGGTHGYDLRDTFLIMLAPLIASGLVAVRALRTYPADVATADLSRRNTMKPEPRGGSVA